MGAKTPVSILQEMMARLGTPPKYDLIYDGSGTHTAVFRYQVYADKVTAIGSGRSKKEAKHEAARKALDRIKQHQIEDVQPPEGSSGGVEVMTPYKDQIKENAIGALHDMCATNEIPMPEYELIEEKGAPHEKLFTYVCCVSKQKEIGTGRTKKQAKQLAAYNMMNRLKGSLDVLKDLKEEEPAPSTESLENAVSRYVSSFGTPRKKIRLNGNPYKYHQFFIDIPVPLQEDARSILSKMNLPDSYRKKTADDWEELFDDLLTTLEGDKKVVVNKPGKDGKTRALVHATFHGEAAFYGTGDTKEDAVQEACLAGLRFLKIMLNDSNVHNKCN